MALKEPSLYIDPRFKELDLIWRYHRLFEFPYVGGMSTSSNKFSCALLKPVIHWESVGRYHGWRHWWSAVYRTAASAVHGIVLLTAEYQWRHYNRVIARNGQFAQQNWSKFYGYKIKYKIKTSTIYKTIQGF